MLVPGMALLLAGCGLAEAPAFDPKGPIAHEQRQLLFETVLVMLVVVIPVIVMTFAFAWRYRASNTKARYRPDWDGSLAIEAVVWLVPAVIVVVLGFYVWNYTHKLDPYAPIEGAGEPLRVEVVAQDWKWVFLYPDQGIATVNELVFPAGRPLSLSLTSDTVMNSFYIPALGSQIYAMAGMETRLHLLADEPGSFLARNSQYSGAGFSDQDFTAKAVTQQDFDAWVAEARASAESLDQAAYETLARPSIDHPVTRYASYEPGLFDRIMARYMGPGDRDGHMEHD